MINCWEKRCLIIIIFILVLITSGVFIFRQANSPVLGTSQENFAETSITLKNIKANLVINTENPKTFENVELKEGETALDLISKVASVSASGVKENAFITGINNRMADSSKNEFWEMIINGKSAEVGAGSYQVNDGDQIEWKISKF